MNSAYNNMQYIVCLPLLSQVKIALIPLSTSQLPRSSKSGISFRSQILILLFKKREKLLTLMPSFNGYVCKLLTSRGVLKTSHVLQRRYEFEIVRWPWYAIQHQHRRERKVNRFVKRCLTALYSYA